MGVTLLAVSSGLISALWVAVCAAAPEYIWQGLTITFSRPSLSDLLEALLIGLILAFFVQPLIDGGRALALRRRTSGLNRTKSQSALFTASLSLAFAVTSVSLHEAMSAFVSGRSLEQAGDHSGLAVGLGITIGWGIVPFAVTIAWMAARNRWLAVPVGLVAGASPYIAGRLFSWPTQEVIVTTIPALFVLAFGYRQIFRDRGIHKLSRFARVVALVALSWLLCALFIDAMLDLVHAAHAGHFRLYATSGYWRDVRFYIGWSVGLLLAPTPTNGRTSRAQSADLVLQKTER